MKKVVIIDGQGGRMGRALVEEIQKLCPGQPLLALGANTTATAAMMKAGAAMGATGENPVLVACRDADLIIGPIGIVIADSLLGEITPRHGSRHRTKPRPENPDSCQWKLLLPPYFSRNTEFTNE